MNPDQRNPDLRMRFEGQHVTDQEGDPVVLVREQTSLNSDVYPMRPDTKGKFVEQDVDQYVEHGTIQHTDPETGETTVKREWDKGVHCGTLEGPVGRISLGMRANVEQPIKVEQYGFITQGTGGNWLKATAHFDQEVQRFHSTREFANQEHSEDEERDDLDRVVFRRERKGDAVTEFHTTYLKKFSVTTGINVTGPDAGRVWQDINALPNRPGTMQDMMIELHTQHGDMNDLRLKSVHTDVELSNAERAQIHDPEAIKKTEERMRKSALLTMIGEQASAR